MLMSFSPLATRQLHLYDALVAINVAALTFSIQFLRPNFHRF
jgi:hypothetical protein